jgi:UDP-2,3-diacylglucosamine hydrolase
MYYFASDMHLGLDARQGATIEREKLLVRWLDEVSADAEAIFLVGDVFDFWFEYRKVIPKGFTRLLGKLSELTDRGVQIHFFTGNHDMWTYDYLGQECGLTVHLQPEIFEIGGKTVFVGHGDNMYTKRPPVLEHTMHRLFRSPVARRLFSALVHPNGAIGFGHWWSGKSRKARSLTHVFTGENEYLVRYAREYMKCVDVDYFVFGHLHCREDYDLGGGKRLIVLGEWLANPSYAVMDGSGNIELKDYK